MSTKLKEIERIYKVYLGGFISSHTAIDIIGDILSSKVIENGQFIGRDDVAVNLDNILVSYKVKR